MGNSRPPSSLVRNGGTDGGIHKAGTRFPGRVSQLELGGLCVHLGLESWGVLFFGYHPTCGLGCHLVEALIQTAAHWPRHLAGILGKGSNGRLSRPLGSH